jgi:hypothetical protein
MFCSTGIDWSATAAWAQAFLSAVAIFAAVALQDREQRKRRQDHNEQRLRAIISIAESCVGTLRKLDERSANETLTHGRYGYYRDETSGDLAAISAVDLTQLDDERLSNEVIKLRRLMRTALRRLALLEPKLRKEAVISKDRFRSTHKQAAGSLARLKALLPKK